MNTGCKRLSLYLILLTFICARLSAQQPNTALPSRGAIKARKLIDVRTGKIVTNVFILVEKNRIISLGSSAPANVPVIDLSNLTVLPGLVDCHF